MLIRRSGFLSDLHLVGWAVLFVSLLLCASPHSATHDCFYALNYSLIMIILHQFVDSLLLCSLCNNNINQLTLVVQPNVLMLMGYKW